MPSYATNRDAHHKIQIDERFEAGIVLHGSEVKSIKSGNCSLKGAYAAIQQSELVLLNMHVGRYEPAGPNQIADATRSRKLLVKKSDLSRLIGKIRSEGMALVPLSVYSKSGLIKVELGLGRGLKKQDKRALIKKRDVNRDIGRAMRVKA